MKKTTSGNLRLSPMDNPVANHSISALGKALDSYVSISNPFDNMKYSVKTRPLLKPILNRHKKYPSVSDLLINREKDNKMCGISVDIARRSPVLSKMLESSAGLNFLKKKILKPLAVEKKNVWSGCDIETPSFNGIRLPLTYKENEVSKDSFSSQKKNSNRNLMERLAAKQANDISFGDSQEKTNNKLKNKL